MSIDGGNTDDSVDWPFEQRLALLNGLTDASRLIELGMDELHVVDGANESTHPLLHLLSHGFERLVKYTLFLAMSAQNAAPPDAKYMKDLSHDIEKALVDLLALVSPDPEYADRPAAALDLDFMRNDPDLKRLLALLSRFGKLDRYYDLNVLIDAKAAELTMDPSAEWKEIEDDFVFRIPGALDAIGSDPTAASRLLIQANRDIAAVLDRFHRCLTRMWFWGALGPEGPATATSVLWKVNVLNDDDLGLPRPPAS